MFDSYCLGWKTEATIKHNVALICTPLHITNYNENNYFSHLDSGDDWSIYTLYAICMIVSAFFSLITLAAYCILPWLRDLQGKVIISLLISLSIGYSTLAYLQLNSINESNAVCAFAGNFYFTNSNLFLKVNFI